METIANKLRVELQGEFLKYSAQLKAELAEVLHFSPWCHNLANSDEGMVTRVGDEIVGWDEDSMVFQLQPDDFGVGWEYNYDEAFSYLHAGSECVYQAFDTDVLQNSNTGYPVACGRDGWNGEKEHLSSVVAASEKGSGPEMPKETSLGDLRVSSVVRPFLEGEDVLGDDLGNEGKDGDEE